MIVAAYDPIPVASSHPVLAKTWAVHRATHQYDTSARLPNRLHNTIDERHTIRCQLHSLTQKMGIPYLSAVDHLPICAAAWMWLGWLVITSLPKNWALGNLSSPGGPGRQVAGKGDFPAARDNFRLPVIGE
jgi:hypothetical protein